MDQTIVESKHDETDGRSMLQRIERGMTTADDARKLSAALNTIIRCVIETKNGKGMDQLDMLRLAGAVFDLMEVLHA